MKKIISTVLFLFTCVILIILGIRFFSGEDNWICENGEWVKHGNPSQPQPISGCGSDPVGMKPRGNLEIQQKFPTEDKIKVTSLKEGDTVISPLEIEGEARGIWYFEGSFPVRVEDAGGKFLGHGNAYAQGEWMTENYVPFHSVVTFDAKGNKKGFVVFEKNNPSDLEENEESIEIPILFK